MGSEDLKLIIRGIVARELAAALGGSAPAPAAPADVPAAPAAPAVPAAAPAPAPAPGGKPPAPQMRFPEKVLTAQDLESVAPGTVVLLRAGTLITPLVRELAEERRLRLREEGEGGLPSVALGADHGGYRLKEALKNFLQEWGYPVFDYGTDSEAPVDYPEYAHKVARAVSENHQALGVIVDGAGIGSCMAANKVPGVRAAQCGSVALARNSREHNYANVLTLGGKIVTVEEARAILTAWLETEWGEERHGRRVQRITEIERRYFRE